MNQCSSLVVVTMQKSERKDTKINSERQIQNKDKGMLFRS